jgi:hypothetical protein
MTYFLLTGDEDADLAKLRCLLDEKKFPPISAQRHSIRMEAENFRSIAGYTVEQGDRKASKRLNLRLQRKEIGHIASAFNEIYASGACYDVSIRYADGGDSQCRFSLHVNGVQQGDPWYAPRTEGQWMTHTIKNVDVNNDDEIMLRGTGKGGALDYVELNYRGPVLAHSSP